MLPRMTDRWRTTCLGEAQHLRAGRHRLEGTAVQRAKHIECGSAPSQQVPAVVLRPADEIGHHRKRQRRRQIRDTVHVLTFYSLPDQLLGLACYDVTHRPQGARQQSVRDQLASLVVFVAVTVERCAARQPVEDPVEADPLAGDERLVVAKRRLALRVARQGVDPLLGQPHHRTESSQP